MTCIETLRIPKIYRNLNALPSGPIATFRFAPTIPQKKKIQSLLMISDNSNLLLITIILKIITTTSDTKIRLLTSGIN